MIPACSHTDPEPDTEAILMTLSTVVIAINVRLLRISKQSD